MATPEEAPIRVAPASINATAYPDIEASKDAYTVDGLHPNDKGYRRIATMVKNFLETHYFGK